MVATSKIAGDDRFVLPPALHALKQPESSLLVKITRGGGIVFGERASGAGVGGRARRELPDGDLRPVRSRRTWASLRAGRAGDRRGAASGAAAIVLRTQPDAQSTRNP